MAYTTKAKVDALNGGSIDSTLFTSLLASVKAFIDRYAGKTFEAVSETRYYNGNGQRVLVIDSFVGTPQVSILNNDGTTFDSLTDGQANDIVSSPYNSLEKNTLQLTGNGFWGSFPNRNQSVKVTAMFGFSTAVPADIEYVATKLIADLADSGSGANVKSESLGDYSVSYGDIAERAEGMGVMTVLDSYRDIDV